MKETSPGHPGFKFLSEKNTLVTDRVYDRYHRFLIRWSRTPEERNQVKAIGKKKRPFIAVLVEN